MTLTMLTTCTTVIKPQVPNFQVLHFQSTRLLPVDELVTVAVISFNVTELLVPAVEIIY